MSKRLYRTTLSIWTEEDTSSWLESDLIRAVEEGQAVINHKSVTDYEKGLAMRTNPRVGRFFEDKNESQG